MERQIDIMGIVNLTDNSYFAESRVLGEKGEVDTEALLGRAGKLVEGGASILDIGACSTRRGSEAVGDETEFRRLSAALPRLREAFPSVKISVDTYWSSVVEKVYDLIGPFIVNDVSAGEADPKMLQTVGRLSLPYVAMHMRGNPKTMQSLTDYSDLRDCPLPALESSWAGLSPVTKAVCAYFWDFGLRAEKAGIKDWILDPGYGFAKTLAQNYELLREQKALLVFGRRILVGVSRKSMIFKLFGLSPEEVLPATQAVHFAALENGASILRVHDATEASQTVEIFRRLS